MPLAILGRKIELVAVSRPFRSPFMRCIRNQIVASNLA